MENILFRRRPRLRKPYLLVAWPGMGEVAFKAASYLVEQLKAEEFARIPAQDFFYLTGSSIQKGVLSTPELPQSSFYFWKNKTGKNDLIIFLSNAQPDLARASEFSQRIISLAKRYKVEAVISLASMPQAVDHLQQPQVWFASTSSELNNSLLKYNFKLFQEGQISGMNGLFLGLAKKAGLKGFCLLGEIPLYTIQIENPRASQAVLEGLSRILQLKIDYSGLVVQAQQIDQEINKLMDYLKPGNSSGGHPAPIGDEEIERIKKGLTQLSGLPSSIKEKIDRLFEEARLDILKARELKAELDQWSVYKEYEDKFLDLFRKKDKGN